MVGVSQENSAACSKTLYLTVHELYFTEPKECHSHTLYVYHSLIGQRGNVGVIHESCQGRWLCTVFAVFNRWGSIQLIKKGDIMRFQQNNVFQNGFDAHLFGIIQNV